MLGAIGEHWQKLFGVAPTDLLWPGRSPAGTCRFDEDLRSLIIQANKSIRLVALGDFQPGDPGFTFSVEMQPQTPAAEFGVFLGYHPGNEGNQFVTQFQTLQLRIMSTALAERTVLVRRCLTKINSQTGLVETTQNHQMILTLPLLPERLLFVVQLRDDSLPLIMLNGQKCHELDSGTRNARFLAADHWGRFGVFMKDGTVWFSHPHFERSPP